MSTKTVLATWKKLGLSVGTDADKNGEDFEFPIVDPESLKEISDIDICTTLNRMLKLDCRNEANREQSTEARFQAIYPMLVKSQIDRYVDAKYGRMGKVSEVLKELENEVRMAKK